MNDDAAVKDASAAAAAAEDLDSKAGNSLMQPLGQGVSAVTMPLCVSAQHSAAQHDTWAGWSLLCSISDMLARMFCHCGAPRAE
jgi:hypothetical protein